MNTLRRSTTVVATALVALAASHADAANCRNENRTFPTSGSESITMRCSHKGGPTTVATLTATALNKVVSALLVTGGSGTQATAFGVDANGSAIPACRVDDNPPADAVAQSKQCAAAVLWRAQLVYVE